MNYLIVDAFASKPFSGNPAAVVPLEASLADSLLQAIAAESNLAETAYPRHLSDGRFERRWFTPTREVPLCGHATLAAAHALWEIKNHAICTNGSVAAGICGVSDCDCRRRHRRSDCAPPCQEARTGISR